MCLHAQGKHAQAQGFFEKSLALRARLLPEDHPDIATCANNLAACLLSQGKPALAQPLFEKALAIRQKHYGKSALATADIDNNLGVCLTESGRPDLAQPHFEKSLAIRRRTLGDGDLATATGYLNLGYCLQAQKKPALARPEFEVALAISASQLGEDHPSTARCRDNLAWCLSRDKPALALLSARQALASRRKILGEGHPSTAASYSTVAVCLWNQGRLAEATRLWQSSLAGLETARFHRAASGFDRAESDAVRFPHRAALAVSLARLGQPRNAFAHAEAGLARGLLDDLASPGEGGPQAAHDLQARLDRLSRTLVSFAGRKDLTSSQIAERDRVLLECRRTSSELARVLSANSARHILPLERIQKAIPADGALVLWIDVAELGEHWGCVVRSQGKPRWERLDGRGNSGAWTADDESLGARLYATLRDAASSAKQRDPLLSDFAAQRFEPLRRHLKATDDLPQVKRLFVVPTGGMARVPAELLAEGYGVSYVPSGSVLARLVENHRGTDGASLLALGDPAFDKAEPPDSGVLVKAVRPDSHAARAGLRAGDILLSIGGAPVGSHGDLKVALARIPAEAAAWREGKRLSLRLSANPLGADFDPRPAGDAVRAWRKADELARGTGHERLPGTYREVEAIASLVKGSTKLLGSAASEQTLDELRARGKLQTFRIIHIATHGESDERQPGRSAVILAQDDLPDPAEQVRDNKHPYDGRLTVSRIRATWELDADLVVLSACETGLGKDAGGDGLLGFSQAFLSVGARCVVLSRWPVDDTATSLLMRRFYQNLLGKRDDQKKPMGRAAALQEAKDWLRKLSAQDAEAAIKSLPRGKLVSTPKAAAKTYGHPYYWAAFTLIGDPD